MGTSALTPAIVGLNVPQALSWGYVWVRGVQINYELADKKKLLINFLGKGEWDSPIRYMINKEFVAPGGNIHFHPGTDGELGHGLAIESNGGDQRVDNHWSYLPTEANAKRTTFSQIAYVMALLDPDPRAPGPDLDFVGEYKARKVRQFDNSGTQTAYAWTTNPAWQIIDAIILDSLQPEGSVGAALTAGEKTRFDFPSFVDTAARNDSDIGGGIKRFETSFAFPQRVPTRQIIDQMLLASRCYLQEYGGKIYLRCDDARAYSFTLTDKHILPGSWQSDKRAVRGATNRFIGKFKDLNLARLATIDTVGNSGAVRTGGALATIKTTNNHELKDGMTVTIQDVADASFNTDLATVTVVDANHFSYPSAGSNVTSGGGTVRDPYSKYTDRSVDLDHEQHQRSVGQRGLGLTPLPTKRPVEIDYGNNTYERVTRLLKYVKHRTLGNDVSPYKAPVAARVRAFNDAVDAADNILALQTTGDVIRVDRSVSEEDQGDYELLEPSRNHGGEEGDTIDATFLQYVPEAFTDVADPEPDYIAPRAGGGGARAGLAAIQKVDSSGVNRLNGNRFADANSSKVGPNTSVISGSTGTNAGNAFTTIATDTINVATGVTQMTFDVTVSQSGTTGGAQLGTGSNVRITIGAQFAERNGNGALTVTGLTPGLQTISLAVKTLAGTRDAIAADARSDTTLTLSRGVLA